MRSWLNVSAFLLLFSISAQADDALHCIEIGQGDRSQTLTNVCDHEVEVLWCHNRNESGYKRSFCGSNGRYYQKQAVLTSGEEKQNQFALPFNSTIYYAACQGSFYSIKEMDASGGYLCN